jgi:cyclic pyranopterin phosphate synthase
MKTKSYQYFQFTKPTPLHFRVIVTKKCNNRCTYCFRESELSPSSDGFTLSFIKKLVNVAIRLKIPKIHFTGGEPLLETRVVSFIKYIKCFSDIDVGLTTNGRLLGDYALRLYEAGLRRVNVSIVSLDKQRYTSICQRNALDSVLSAVDELVALKFNPIKINVPIFARNVDEIGNFICHFLPKYNTTLRFFSILPANGLQKDDYLSDKETVENLGKAIGGLSSSLQKVCRDRVFYRPRTVPGFVFCQKCGFRSMCHDQAKAIRVTGDGGLSLCRLNSRYYARIRDESDIEEVTKRFLSYLDKRY